MTARLLVVVGHCSIHDPETALDYAARLIGSLLKMWWRDWPDERLHAAMPLLTSGEVEKLHRHWLEKVRTS
ncbi:phospho-2-dehydro-3-deoxyheptonate aldolase [Paracoccus versutus]|uniref:Phospho-2-dehydro-3-deoxyheptonate aldolase n=1 Tax=Paracoccus versutus TaxID=34007 RepID=A0AAQ0HIN6_PARVE|nr:hypothetical protein [Paracoccus versutus]KGJ07594.1 hypothetical protein IT40_20470 [Paracoccus versutus]REG45858.1 phospho-2-dehydro-3-deoxyheptonate aldolase [Paracoccus versutus]